MTDIQSEADAWRAKGLPGNEIIQSKPFLSDAERYKEARRLGRAIASLEQCIEFALNVDDEMTRWATDFEQLWEAAKKLFASLPYSPAGASLRDAVEVFECCRQRYESDQRYPTESSIEAMRIARRSVTNGRRRQSRPSFGP